MITLLFLIAAFAAIASIGVFVGEHIERHLQERRRGGIDFDERATAQLKALGRIHEEYRNDLRVPIKF